MVESLKADQIPLVADFSSNQPASKLADVRVGIITFPGTLDDRDASRAVRLAGGTPVGLWHNEAQLHKVDAVIIPGGFSYGDYLRAGAIAAQAALMKKVVQAAQSQQALPVLGICNGFQVLTEAHLLPGAMIKNNHRKFICRDQSLQIENAATSWTRDYRAGQKIVVPLKNQDGQYLADDSTLAELEEEQRVVFRYVGDNPNGSRNNIAGICNAQGNVVGLMPHPEHAVEAGFGPSASAAGPVDLRAGTDGLGIFTSVLHSIIHAS